MSEQLDPQASYDYIDRQGVKCGQVRQSRFFGWRGRNGELLMAGFLTTTVCWLVA